MTEPENLPLAADFPPTTRQDWRKLVDAVLKGTPFERLKSTTYDGVAIEPLADRRANAWPIAARPGQTAWQILARIEHPDPAQANEIALRELENGANGLSLIFSGSLGGYGFGVPATDQALARALQGVKLDARIVLDVDLPPFARELPQQLADLVKRSVNPAAANIRFGYDPLTAMAMSGRIPLPWSETAPLMAGLIRSLADAGFKGPFAVGDGRVVHNACGSEAQELAFALGGAVAYLRALEASGMPLEAAQAAVYFRLAADADQLLTVAKFRALRKLWARVGAACGLAPRPVLVAAETAWRMMARRDPQVNILRTTVAIFAAAVGGADAITVLPFTAACGLPDRFARRIARNNQLILDEEVHLEKVTDPAVGSGAVEDVTGALCRTAWALFADIEAAGGVAAALESGAIQDKIASVRAKRAAAVARRRDALTGVSIFPNLHEARAVIDAPFPPAKSDGPREIKGEAITPLLSMRLGQEFETLRDTSDHLAASDGARPKVFLATLGRQAEFTARATFAKNFFEAGGIEAVFGPETEDSRSIVKAYRESGAKLACLCSSDRIYCDAAAAVALALQGAGATLYLAGRPGELEEELRKAGVTRFIFAGCDMLGSLQRALEEAK